MPCCDQGEVMSDEPVKQDDDGFDVPLGGEELAVGGVGLAQPAAQPSQEGPDGIAVQQATRSTYTAILPGQTGIIDARLWT